MSFSVLPPELKERIAFDVRAQDRTYRQRHEYDPNDEDALYLRDGWYGRGLFALGAVSREMREIVVPMLHEPVDFRKIPYDSLANFGTSFAAQLCRKAILAEPHCLRSSEQYHATGRGRKPWHVVEGILAACATMPRLHELKVRVGLVLDGEGGDAEHSTEESARAAFMRTYPSFLPVARRIKTWNISSRDTRITATCLRLAPAAIERLTVGLPDAKAKDGHEALVKALVECTSLSFLHMHSVRSMHRMRPRTDRTAMGPAFANAPSFPSTLTTLVLNLDRFDETVPMFLSHIPSLQRLEMSLLEAKGAVQPPFIAPCLPSLTSLTVYRRQFAETLATCLAVSAPHLQELVFGADIFDCLNSAEVTSLGVNFPALQTLSINPGYMLDEQALVASIDRLHTQLADLPSSPQLIWRLPPWLEDPGSAEHEAVDEDEAVIQDKDEAEVEDGVVIANGIDDAPPTAEDEARELLEWARTALQAASLNGDIGQARLIREGLVGLVKLQDRMAEGYVSSRSALM
ncbi:hypothetical protein JCM10213_004141 [Rhodosporidiobolus nylandii]